VTTVLHDARYRERAQEFMAHGTGVDGAERAAGVLEEIARRGDTGRLSRGRRRRR
jgi:UDP:flavonoid glycosyltransferase YjiC (YdhE family)